MHTGRLFIVSGPSGAGKGTLVRALLERVPALWLSVSATTRPPRPGERPGVDYLFLSDDEFDQLVREDGLLEWAEVHGNRYGTPREPVERAMCDGRDVVLEIDPQGAMQVQERVRDAILVFIEPPSFDELRRRLAMRGSESREQVERRMQTAEREMEFAGTYDYVVINDDVCSATERLADIVERLIRREAPETKDETRHGHQP